MKSEVFNQNNRMCEENTQPLLTESQESEILQDLGLATLSPNMISNILTEYNINVNETDFQANPHHLQHNLQGSFVYVIDNDRDISYHEDIKQVNGYSESATSSSPTESAPQSPPVPPPPTSSIISNEDYPGPLNFDVFINPHLVPGNKTWVYSEKLRKIYIGMGISFPVDFRCNPSNQVLFVRATPLYSVSQFAQEPVIRCIAHAQRSDGSNQGFPAHVWSHIIRCHSLGAVYQGNVEQKERLSVVVPLEKPQTGSDTVRINYQFVCKNSCPSGMNRRPMEVVFTLEDYQGNVLGRTKVSIRVCSSPKRDREKEERERMANGELPSSKRRKENPKKPTNKDGNDFKIHEVTIPIVGSNTVNHILRVAYDAMAGDQKRYNVEEPFQEAMSRIMSMMAILLVAIKQQTLLLRTLTLSIIFLTIALVEMAEKTILYLSL